MDNQIVIPGTRIGGEEDYEAGPGTYIRHKYIFSSLVGKVEISSGTQGEKPTVSVARSAEPSLVPSVGSIVTGQVTRVNPRFASVKILCLGDVGLSESYGGIIRVHDVRQTQTDQVEIYKSFRPGDIVRAVVISLGTSRSYYLSTAKNDLGVIFARSVAGVTMVPISWELMQCPKTKTKEHRKVCRI
eukprot:CAMPEP_0201509104 /NCGR_PEP_ID=MMETSP0161_2-20130828/2255_1 /ASSEMBLY_ACC=CAM_ASM_000251 /TAXON_ID=180227 /ORGANISM="Neoparamoeba aestuarina, Strain SoJaBio B1-5/56/2" /LENGTH=186 /DNA_ID=CAMNT_0047903957 /DNA_START=73 /DNA_END=633 /DNA_ORIENTATION=+